MYIPVSALDRSRASHWLTERRGKTWRGPCNYCPDPAVVAYAGRVVERLACHRHAAAAADAHRFDVHMQTAVDRGICKAQQGPDGQWSGGFRN